MAELGGELLAFDVDTDRPKLMFDGVRDPPSTLKYDETKYLEEFSNYVADTYKAHYAVSNGVQSFDLVHATGRAEGFILGSIIKYATRFGRKNGNDRRDILKIVHYCLLLLWTMDQKTDNKI